MARYLIVLSGLLVSMFVISCGSSGGGDANAITRLQVSVDRPELPVGVQGQLSAIAYYEDGSTQNLTSVVVWTTDLDGVVEIGVLGEVTGVSAGTVLVTASYNEFKASTTIQVSDAILQAIEILPISIELAVGQSQQLQVRGQYSDGSYHDLSSHNELEWLISDTNVVSIDQNTALLWALAIGSANVDVRLGSIETEYPVRVRVDEAQLESFVITPESLNVPLGKSLQFTAIANYSDNTSRDVTANVAWRSEPDGVLVYLSEGTYLADDIGVASVSAWFDTATQSNVAQVAVENAVYESLTLASSNVQIPNGRFAQLSLQAQMSDGGLEDVTGYKQVFWQSSDTSVATVSVDGKVSAHQIGSTTISVTFSGLQTELPIAVIDAALERIDVLPENVILTDSHSQQYTAMGFYSDGSSHELTFDTDLVWQTSRKDESQISSGGVLSAYEGSADEPVVAVVSASIGDITGKQDVYLPLAQTLRPNHGDLFGLEFAGGLTSLEADALGIMYEGNTIEQFPTGPADINFATMEYPSAVEYCAQLVVNGIAKGWRLPTRDELKALFNFYDGIPDSNGDYRLYLDHGWAVYWEFWSSTSVFENTHTMVSLSQGFVEDAIVDTGEGAKGYTACVRDLP